MKYLLTLLLSLCFNFAIAQSGLSWTPTIDIATSLTSNQHPRIAADAAGNPMVVWGKFTTSEVYFSRWNDTAFTAPVVLNPVANPAFTLSWAGPDIASFGDTVYVVYKQIPEDSNHIYLQRSFDGGLNFSSPIQVDQLTDSISRFPVVTTDSIGNPVVAYMKFDPTFNNPVYVVCRSNDFGSTFNTDQLASMYFGEYVDECSPGAMITSGNRAALLFRDNFTSFRTIYCGLSNDNSNSFPSYMQVDLTSWLFGSCPSSGPDGFISGDSIYSVFMSGVSGGALCYFSASSLSTYSAGPSVALTDTTGGISNQDFPRISNYGNKTGIVCRQTFNGDGQLAFFYSSDITNGLPHSFDTLANGNVVNTDIIMTRTAVHVVWQDDNSETVKYRMAVFPTTSVSEINNDNAISIYPSPSKGDFNIRLKNNLTEILSIDIVDIEGRKIPFIFSRTASGFQCYLNNVNPGIYFVSIKDSLSNSYFGKLSIN